MRSVSPAALAWLRQTLTLEASAPLRIRPRPSRCNVCATASAPLHARLQWRRLRYSTARTTSAQASSQPSAHPSTNQPEPQPAQASAEQSPPQTHYDFFPISLPQGPPPKGSFKIDLSALKKEFLQLQSRAHPDLHTASNKSRAQALSSRINEAYKTLESPLLRAQYLLSLHGISTSSDETAKVEDQELLMEVMEVRERIEEAESEEEIAELREENEGRIKRSEEVLGEAFEGDDLEGARREAVRLRYWVNVREALREWEPGKEVVLQH